MALQLRALQEELKRWAMTDRTGVAKVKVIVILLIGLYRGQRWAIGDKDWGEFKRYIGG